MGAGFIQPDFPSAPAGTATAALREIKVPKSRWTSFASFAILDTLLLVPAYPNTELRMQSGFLSLVTMAIN